MAASRTRNYGCVVYPESAPENWLEILNEEKTPCFVSPLHDADVDPQEQPKKPHYHVVFMYDSVKTEEQVRKVFESFGGVGLETVKSLRGYARYLCHLDNPEKAQYDIGKVKALFGADYIEVISLAIDVDNALQEIEDFCEKYNITSFYVLSRYASKHRSDWSRIIRRSCSVYLREYLTSRKWSVEHDSMSIIDQETGEEYFNCSEMS